MPYLDLNQTANNFIAGTTSSVQYTLPKPHAWYFLHAVDNTFYLKGGANPTATAEGPGCGITVGATVGPVLLEGPIIAGICSSTGGALYIVPALNTNEVSQL